MTMSITVEEDGLVLRNTSGTDDLGSKDKSDGTFLRADCADFRQFLTEAKAGKYDNLV